MPARLRARRSSDDRFIEELSEAAFSEYTAVARARARDALGGARTTVAAFDEKPIGFATVRISAEVAHLDAIAVSEPDRGRGVGRALLAAAERDALGRGARSMQLVTAESNLAALDLFLKCGYRIVRTLPRFYPRGQTAHVLEKAL